MQFQIDTKFMTDCFQHIVSIPSPVGYFEELNPVLAEYAARFGKEMTFDNRHTAYITLNIPEKRNPISNETKLELLDAFDICDFDPAIRAVVIRGERIVAAACMIAFGMSFAFPKVISHMGKERATEA